MKYSLLLFLLFTYFDLSAQRRNEEVLYYTQKYDTITWYNKEIQSQVKDVHGDFILFYFSWRSDRLTIDPQKDPPGWTSPTMNIFHFGFGAAAEIWERKFGQRFPEELFLAKLQSLRDERKEHLTIHGRIYRDSIFIERSWSVPVMGLIDSTIPADSVESRETMVDENGQVDSVTMSREEENRIFERVMQLDGEFTGGVKALHALINDQMRDAKFEIAAGDSIIYFRGVIKKDSMLHDLKLIEPVQATAYTKKLADILVKPKRQWLPVRKDRILNAYMLIYIRVKRDGTLDVDYL